MDRITQSLLTDYQEQFQIEHDRVDKVFEMFCNYAIVSQFSSGEFDIQDASTGGVNDSGIDGLAFIADGQVIDSVEMLSNLTQQHHMIPEMKIIFVQAKTSPKFLQGDILKFWYGVKGFLAEESAGRRNQDIQDKAEILRYITEHPLQFDSIAVKLFYVTTGKYHGDDSPILSEVKKNINKEILDVNVTRDVEIEFFGAYEIQQAYKQTKQKPSAVIEFELHTLLPEIRDIQQAFIGYLPLVEFKKLIVDTKGELRKGIYYDNVRDFQGENNPVNTDIAKTMAEKPDQLAVLNNGITIVAKKIKQVRNTFHLEDYQIVNGCQTSHMLYRYLDQVDTSQVGLQVKLIVTENDQVTNEVIKATNNQTPVKREELLALLNYQKTLEDYYNSFHEHSLRLYYERRDGQYAFDNAIKKVRIIDVKQQLKSFTAMFLDQPELANGKFEILTKEIKGKYFVDNHHNIVYYTSAFALYKLEYLIRNHQLDSKYRKFKFHLLMLLKYIINGKQKVPFPNSQKINDYCQAIIQSLDSDQLLHYFQKATNIIDHVVTDIHDRTIVKKSTLAHSLKKMVYVKE